MLALTLSIPLVFHAACARAAHVDVQDDQVRRHDLGFASMGEGSIGLRWLALVPLHCAADDSLRADLPRKLALSAWKVSEGSVNEHGMGIPAHLQASNPVRLIIQQRCYRFTQVCP